MDTNLETSLDLVFGHEGGYVNAASDRGGPTKYGITHRTLAAWRGVDFVSAEDVRKLTLAEAAEIYRAGYWVQSGGSLLPSGLDYAAFDYGVNSGPSRAVKSLQKVLGVEQDGSIGPFTMAAVRRYEGGVAKLIVDYCNERMRFLKSLGNQKTGFPANGRGWTIRVTGKDPRGEWPDKPGVLGNALRMARGNPPGKNEAVEAPKAAPAKPNPWTKPETLVQLLPGVGGLSFLATGSGPVQYGVGAALAVAALLAAFFFIKREIA